MNRCDLICEVGRRFPCSCTACGISRDGVLRRSLKAIQPHIKIAGKPRSSNQLPHISADDGKRRFAIVQRISPFFFWLPHLRLIPVYAGSAYAPAASAYEIGTARIFLRERLEKSVKI